MFIKRDNVLVREFYEPKTASIGAFGIFFHTEKEREKEGVRDLKMISRSIWVLGELLDMFIFE